MIYSGILSLYLNENDLAKFYQGEFPIAQDLLENQYLVLKDGNDNAFDYFKKKNGRLVNVPFSSFESQFCGVLKPRNPEQRCLVDLLHDDDVPVKLTTGRPGSGKAQPVSTIIPTPQGDKRLGDIKPGDYIFDRQGKPTKVLGVFPQGKIDNYKIYFQDDRVAYCNEEHIWTCYTSKKNFKNFTVREMLQRGLQTSNGDYRFKIPLNKAIFMPEKDFEIDPYIMGVFLGDNCCLERGLSISNTDKEIIDEVGRLIGVKEIRKASDYNFHSKLFFKNYPELICYAKDKKIPKEYLYGSIEQRLALLQGLLDTDGTIDPQRGRVRFTTTSYQLKEDVKKLVWSLGYLCSESIDDRVGSVHKNICYNLSIGAPPQDKPLLFRLKRKKEIAEKIPVNKKISRSKTLTIRRIEKMPEQEEMVCLYVDNEEHLYLTEDFIVTHNTMLMIAGAMEALQRQKFEKIVFVRNNVQVRDTDSLGALPGLT